MTDSLSPSYDELILKAKAIATANHAGQKRNNEQDYIVHPEAVADRVKHQVGKVVAWLHDVIEDTNVTLDDLRQEGFTEFIIECVDILTHKKNESYFDYVMRIRDCGKALPIIVKLADLDHNLSDLNKGSLKDKYEFAQYILTQKLQSMNMEDQIQ